MTSYRKLDEAGETVIITALQSFTTIGELNKELQTPALMQSSLPTSAGGFANPHALAPLFFLAANREMLSAFQKMPMIITSINLLRNQPDNILTASLERSFAGLTSLSYTESATHCSEPLSKARHHLQHDYTVLHRKKVHDHLTTLDMPAAQDPQDPSHKDARYNPIRLRCPSRHNVACLRALLTISTLRFDDESFAFVFRIILDTRP